MDYLADFEKNVSKIIKKKNFRNKLSSYRNLFPFFLSIVLILTLKCIQFPSLTLHSEMFNENGTNFFFNAYNNNLWTNLTTVDAGYLPWLQRIISVIIVKLFHIIYWYPFASQWAGFIVLSIFCSIIVLPVFRKLIKSDLIRLLVAVSMGMISDYELNEYMNFVYFGSLFAFLMIFIDKEKINKFFVASLGIITGIIFCSKGYFIVFLPVYFLLLLFHFKKRQKRSAAYYGISLIMGFIQVSVMAINSTNPEHQGNQNPIVFFFYFLKSIYYLVLTYQHVLIGSFTGDKGHLMSVILLFIILMIGLWKILKKKNVYLLSFILIGNLIAFTALFFTIMIAHPNIGPFSRIVTNSQAQISTAPAMTPKPHIYNQQTKVDMNTGIFFVKHLANLRHMLISNIIIYLVGIVIILSIFDKKSYKLLTLGFIIYASGAFGQITVEEPSLDQLQSYSQWRIYSKLLQNPKYCIPENHYPSLIHKDCDYLLKEDNKLSSSIKLAQSINLSKIDPLSKNWKIQSVILINNPNMFSSNSMFTLFAYDKNYKLIGTARQLTPSNYNYLYYLFDNQISNAEKFKLINSKGKEVRISPNIIVFGEKK